MFNLFNNISSHIPPAPSFQKGETILNCKIDSITLDQTLRKILGFLSSNFQHRIVTVNAEYILEAQKDEEFRNIINSADLCVPDGIGIIWAAKFLSLPASRYKILRFPQIVVQYVYTGASLIFWPSYCKSVIKERVSGVDLIEKILNKSEIRNIKKIRDSGFGIRIFLIGGYDGAAERIRKEWPGVIVGTYVGSPNIEDDEKASEAINQAKPNILFVAYGNPASKQEKWISRNLPHLPSVRLAMGAGGSFDFLAGRIKRAPKWMQKLGIEWLWRVIREPERFKRIWNAVVVFSLSILSYKLHNNQDTRYNNQINFNNQ